MRPNSPQSFDAESFRVKASTGGKSSEVTTNATVFSQGDKAEHVFFVKAGAVKITVVSRRGKEAVLGIVPARHFFGEGVLTGQHVRVSTATALEPSSILSISRARMLSLLNDEPKFSEAFVTYLVGRNLRIEEDLVDQLFNSTEKRLARALLLLAKFGKEGKPETVIPHITQESLAEMIGTTRPRVSFFMNKFRRMGFIEYNGKITVHSSLLNIVLYD